MPGIDERREISEFIDQVGKRGFPFTKENIAKAIGVNSSFDRECWKELAKLIRPPMQNVETLANQKTRYEMKKLYDKLTSDVITIPLVAGDYQSGYAAAYHDIALMIKDMLDKNTYGEDN